MLYLASSPNSKECISEHFCLHSQSWQLFPNANTSHMFVKEIRISLIETIKKKKDPKSFPFFFCFSAATFWMEKGTTYWTCQKVFLSAIVKCIFAVEIASSSKSSKKGPPCRAFRKPPPAAIPSERGFNDAVCKTLQLLTERRPQPLT